MSANGAISTTAWGNAPGFIAAKIDSAESAIQNSVSILASQVIHARADRRQLPPL
jgi:hypothetical protein